MSRNVTLQSLADELGISKSTVSRAFGRPELLDDETVKTICELAKKREYRPNISAKNLAVGKSGLFALLLPELNYILGDFLSKILYGIELELDAARSSIVLSSYGKEGGAKSIFSTVLARADIEGAFVFAKSLTPENLRELSKPPLPCVLLDLKNDSIPCVYTDNFKVGYAMAETLLASGHRKIAIMPGESEWANADERTCGMLACLKEHSAKPPRDFILPCRFNYGFLDAKSRFEDFAKSFGKTRLPTALIAGNDDIAAGVYRAAEELCIKIPGDISVIACDNNFFCDYLSPPLTSIDQNGCEIGVKAAQMLLGKIPKISCPCAHTLISRKSIATLASHPS